MRKISTLLIAICFAIGFVNAQIGWQEQTSGTTSGLSSMFFTSQNVGFVVGYGGTILKTTDAGSNWSISLVDAQYDLTSIFFSDSLNGYAAGLLGSWAGIILKTTNGGNDWIAQPAQINGHDYFLYSIYFTSTNIGYGAGYNFFDQQGIIVKTVDAGATWTIQLSGTITWLHSIFFIDANTGYAVGGYGTILKTIDAGSTWIAQTSGTTKDLFSIHFVDSNTGYVVGNNGTILKTTNASTYWIPQTSGTTSNLTSVYFPSTSIGYTISDVGSIHKTINAGIDWSDQINGTNNLFADTYFTNDTIGFVVGNTGLILKTINGGNSPPYITTHPLSKFISFGQNISFSITTTGSSLNYQWKKNNINIANATNSILNINNANYTDEGLYSCEVSNMFGTVVSNTAELMIPDNIEFVGDSIEINVTNAIGNVQWQQSYDTINWVDIANATTYSYSFVSTNNPSGKQYYRAKISDPLCLLSSPVYSKIIRNKIYNNITDLSNGVWYNGGIVFYTDGLGNGLLALLNEQSSSFNWGCSGTFIIGAQSVTDGAVNTTLINTACSSSAASICDSLTTNGYNDWFLPAKDQLNYLYQQRSIFGIGGYSYWSSTETDATHACSQNFSNGSQITPVRTANAHVRCVRSYTPNISKKLFSTTVTNQPVTVVIMSQPINQAICKGNNFILSLNASGTQPLYYQWKKGGVNIINATNDTYTIENLAVPDEGIYTCTATNLCRSITSTAATLKVIALSVNAGQDVTFCNDTVVHLQATGLTNHISESGTLSYSWSPTTDLSSSNISNPVAQPLTNTTYTVTLQDINFCSVSANISLTSKTPVSISAQPANQNKCLNSNVDFSFSTNGTSPITFQWKKDGVNIPNATSANYTKNSLTVADEGLYTCTAINLCRSVTSTAATLKVIDLSVNAGSDVTFCNDTVVHLQATGATNHISESGTLSYSWSPATGLNFSNISNPIAQPLSNTTYTVTLQDINYCSVSSNITLTSKTPVSISAQPASQNKCLNSNVNFSFSTNGTTPISYQWKFNGNSVSGANNNSFSKNNLVLSDEGIYTCDASNYCNSISSANAILKVVDLTVNAGGDKNICKNGNTNILATASSNHSSESGSLTYIWSPSGGLSSTVVNNPVANPTTTTNYTLTVTDQLGCSKTDGMQVFVQEVFQDEEICMVTIDLNTWKNKILWQKTQGKGTAGYNIFKEVGTNIYSGIGYVPFNDPAEYIDYSSNPESFANRYKIMAIDTCGAESLKSYFHKSINLTIAAIGSTMGLNWTDYVDESGVFIPTNYFIYRGTSPTNMQLLDSVPGGTNSYNDNNVFNLYYYIIGVKKVDGCNTAKSMITSFSNKKDNSSYVGISKMESAVEALNIFPNPFTNHTTINFSNPEKSNYKLIISDITGKVVFDKTDITGNSYILNRSSLQSGIYFIELRGTNIYKGKLIVE